MFRRVALTGTPGTGKTTVARMISEERSVVEVGELARQFGAALGGPEAVVVDLERLADSFRHHPTRVSAQVVVGHLAHLLPIRDVVVLRCHPVELGRRLVSSHRGNLRSRRENMLAEAVSVVTAEAAARRRNIFEVDTTRIPPSRVAQKVAAWIAGARRPSWGAVDWLRDPAVTEHLLEWTQ